MTTYTHNEIAVPGGAQWFNVTIDGNDHSTTRTSTLLVLPNSDGTQTHIIGTNFTYDVDGNPTGGWVTQIDRTSIGGATVYETVTGLEPIYLYYMPTGGSDGDPLLVFGFENDLDSVFYLLTSPSFGFGLIYRLCDTLNGFSGDDLFFGGGPPGVNFTGAFTKSFDGGSGMDTVSYDNALYGVRADLNTGGAGGDTCTSIENLIGSSLSDILFGNSSVNVLSGGLGNDLLAGMGGDDTMIGGAGNDIYLVDSASDVVMENPGEGTDIVFASVDYTLGPNIETLGRLVSGDHTVIGGAGDDLYLVDSTSGLVNENLGEGNDTVYAVVDYTIGPNIEELVLVEGAGNINGSGNDLNNVLVGNPGSNVLDGKGGDDTMIGGPGDDFYFVDSTNDLVIENALWSEGTDIVFASVDYTIGPNIERLTLVEGAGDINGWGNDIDYNTLVGNSGNNTLYGMGGLDRIYGGGGNDTLYGGDGNDVELNGGTGDDTMIGGAGSERYYVDSTSDRVIENPGEGFELVYASADYTIGPNIEALTLVNGAGDINGWGNDIDNELLGSSGNNVLDGKGGHDSLNGFGGNDTFVFAAGEADGDEVHDFMGNGALAGDSFRFVGFGTAARGATFTQIGDTNQWQIHSALDGHNEFITLPYGASVHPSDYVFQGAAGNAAPVASNDSYTTKEGKMLTVSAAAGVLANDSDADGDPLHAALISSPAHGNVTFNSDGSFVYKPLAHYNGADSFTYKAFDGNASSDVTTVSITVSAATGNGDFMAPTFELAAFGTNAGGWSSDNTYPRTLADVNGDGMADIVGFSSAGVFESLATGGGQFATPTFELAAFGTNAGGWSSDNTYPRALADVNGDHRADIVGFGADGVSVSLATGGGDFAAPTLELAAFGTNAGGWTSQDLYPRTLADVNGDGKADIVGFGADGVFVSLATGGGHFASPTLQLSAFGPNAGGWNSDDLYPRTLADVNGDNMADIVGFASSGVMVSLATGNGHFAAPTFELPDFAPDAGGWSSDDLYKRELADVNGDNMADIVGFASSGVYVSQADFLLV
jgi:Ca2+-binding RTX toxin-like protein